MAYKMVEKKFDDFDGKELPDNTRPWKVRFNGKEAEVLVSPENRTKIEEYMGRILDSARQRPGSGASSPVKRAAAKKATGKKRNLVEVRKWLRENGHEVPERGVLAQELIDIYEAGQSKPVSASSVKKAPAKKTTAKKASTSSSSAKKTTAKKAPVKSSAPAKKASVPAAKTSDAPKVTPAVETTPDPAPSATESAADATSTPEEAVAAS
ncbi:histone-like nucleoid-structuring protein Lsr2 [Aeromicrobium sp. 179-A 4D2 NHS]|uniref:Lsr2 family DNA-binding protein n=1 Tax=Aeromicrobium sp. 179-A 4D2 NHS TaxID=3142375 RepID=UPI0039A15FE9